jgi:hypothetical protein
MYNFHDKCALFKTNSNCVAPDCLLFVKCTHKRKHVSRWVHWQAEQQLMKLTRPCLSLQTKALSQICTCADESYCQGTARICFDLIIYLSCLAIWRVRKPEHTVSMASSLIHGDACWWYAPRNETSCMQVVYEDDDIIIVSKPGGMLCHRWSCQCIVCVCVCVCTCVCLLHANLFCVWAYVYMYVCVYIDMWMCTYAPFQSSN